jgi:hypothetical protein
MAPDRGFANGTKSAASTSPTGPKALLDLVLRLVYIRASEKVTDFTHV